MTLLAGSPAPQAAAEGAARVGAYSNIIVTGEHAKGYSIQLWREGRQYFGFFLSAAGLAGDTPLGVLENLRFDEKSKHLSFEARLSVGVATMDGENWVPTRDIYRFDGIVFPGQITGSLVHVNALEPDKPGTHEQVKLYRSKDEEMMMPPTATYKEWAESARQVLRARGPKW